MAKVELEMKTPMNPVSDAANNYEKGMLLIRHRFLEIEKDYGSEQHLMRVERIALQVRKIVEGVAYGALSASEYHNVRRLQDRRTMDAAKLLNFLNSKKMLKLPTAQRIGPPEGDCPIVLLGVKDKDIGVDEINGIYSRSSALIHERHPERIEPKQIQDEYDRIRADAQRLREWLWLHVVFFTGQGFLVQMGQAGTPSFMVALSR